jgi:hypothetical protein
MLLTPSIFFVVISDSEKNMIKKNTSVLSIQEYTVRRQGWHTCLAIVMPSFSKSFGKVKPKENFFLEFQFIKRQENSKEHFLINWGTSRNTNK